MRATSGPPHDKEFAVEVLVHGNALATGAGKTKKHAEQEAAKEAYKKLLNTEIAVMLVQLKNAIAADPRVLRVNIIDFNFSNGAWLCNPVIDTLYEKDVKIEVGL